VCDIVSNNQPNFLIFIAIFLLLVFFIRVEPHVTAFAGFNSWNTTNTTVTESSENPSISSIAIDQHPVDLVAGSTRTVSCSATVSDDNGIADIQGGKGNITIYDSAVTTSACSANKFNCYKNTTYSSGLDANVCPGSGSEVTCNFTVPMYYNANSSTAWKCYMYIEDQGANNDTDETTDKTINDLTGIDIGSATMNFGTLSPGSFSDNISQAIYNYGNIILDVQLNGTNMTCGAGENIGVGNLTYNITGEIPDASWGDYNLSGTLQNRDFNLYPNRSTTDDSIPTSPTNSTYWKLYLPMSQAGSRGTCTGTIWFVGNPSS